MQIWVRQVHWVHGIFVSPIVIFSVPWATRLN